jgi:hypothetical protein
MEMYDLGSGEYGKHQYGEQHHPSHGRCTIELALAFHALRTRGKPERTETTIVKLIHSATFVN